MPPPQDDWLASISAAGAVAHHLGKKIEVQAEGITVASTVVLAQPLGVKARSMHANTVL